MFERNQDIGRGSPSVKKVSVPSAVKRTSKNLFLLSTKRTLNLRAIFSDALEEVVLNVGNRAKEGNHE